jgi:hypothetical protein
MKIKNMVNQILTRVPGGHAIVSRFEICLSPRIAVGAVGGGSMFAHGTKQGSSALIVASLQRRWLMKAVLPLFFAGLLGFGTTGASAQTAPGDPAGNQTIPEKDLSRPDESRPGRAQGGSAVDNREKNLSDKLDASGGVIKPPPGVDPEIVKPAPVPEPNSTPVIPPPGVPGGPPGPEPK